MASAEEAFEGTFKEMFRRHAAGVAIITVNYDGVPYGFTATSVASLSAKPPRFTFNMARTSRSWPAVANSAYIGVHMLGLENQELADRFARTRDRFEGDHWALGPHEVPILKDVTGWLIGKIQMRRRGGRRRARRRQRTAALPRWQLQPAGAAGLRNLGCGLS